MKAPVKLQHLPASLSVLFLQIYSVDFGELSIKMSSPTLFLEPFLRLTAQRRRQHSTKSDTKFLRFFCRPPRSGFLALNFPAQYLVVCNAVKYRFAGPGAQWGAQGGFAPSHRWVQRHPEREDENHKDASDQVPILTCCQKMPKGERKKAVGRWLLPTL